MAVKKFDASKDAVKDGQWICLANIYVNEGIGKPTRVSQVKGERVYWEKIVEGEVIDKGYCSKKSIHYLSDSQEEALAVWMLDSERRKVVDQTVARVTKEINDEYASRISALLID